MSPITSWVVQNYTNVLNDDSLSSILLRGGQQVLLPAFPANQFTKSKTKEHIFGYCYKSSSISDYLAVAVIVTHLVVAVSHTIWILCRRETSGCWDTVAELVPLAQNSRPALPMLSNILAPVSKNLEHSHMWLGFVLRKLERAG